jgi:hypothetical protein
MLELADAATHLDWADTVVRTLRRGEARRAADRLLTQARARLADPDLHLAVVGEFSVGKSTWINALLGASLFPASVLPCTKAVTEIRSGTPASVSLELRDGRVVTWSEPASIEDSELARVVRGLGELADRPRLPDVLGATAAEPAIAAAVLRRVLTWPAEILGGDVVLYDTPGSNDEEDREQLTSQYVLERCDLLVAVVRADHAVPKTFVSFMRKLLPVIGPDGCVFVVTRMDVVDPGERARTRSVIERRIARQLGIERPVMLEMVPTASLLLRAGGPDPDGFGADFDRQAHVLRQALVRRRAAFVSRRAMSAATSVLESVADTLATEEAEVAAEERELRAVSIGDPERFTVELLAEIGAEVDSTCADWRIRTRAEMSAQLEQLGTDGEKHLSKATTAASLEQQAGALPALVSAGLGLAGTVLDVEIRELHESLTGHLDEVSRRLHDHYGELLSLARGDVALELDAPRTPVMGGSASVALSDVMTAMRQQTRNAQGAGAAAGAVIGTLFVPGFGTAAGAALGAWLGGAFGPSLDERKRRAGSAFAGQLSGQIRPRVMAAVDRAGESAGHEAHAVAREQMAAFVRRYGTTVTRLRADQDRRRTDVHRRRRELEGLRHEAQGRMQAIARTGLERPA